MLFLKMLSYRFIIDLDLDAADGVVMGLALFYGGFIQLLAGMWEFTTGNTYGAVAFTSYGGFWMSLAALNMKCFGFLEGYGTDVDNLQKGLGIYLLAWAIFSLFMLIASHRTTLVSRMWTITESPHSSEGERDARRRRQ